MPVRATGSDVNMENWKTVARPASTRVGDVMVLWLCNDNQTRPVFTFPAGWMPVPPGGVLHHDLLGSGGDSGGLACAYKVATANEPGSYTIQDSTGVPANIAGIIVLSGVTVRGARTAGTMLPAVYASPWRMPLRGVPLNGPAELLWIGASDLVNNSNVAHTPPPGFAVVGDYVDNSSQFNNVLVAHRTVRGGTHTGTAVAVGTASGNSGVMGFLLAFPVIGRTRLVMPTFRTLRPSFDVSNSGWGIV